MSLHSLPGNRLKGMQENLSAFAYWLCVFCVQGRCEQLEKEADFVQPERNEAH